MADPDYPTQSPSQESPGLLKSTVEGSVKGTLGLVLCGGEGRRMGGVDKGLISIDGMPAVLRSLKLLEPLCDSCFISANRNQDVYSKLTVATVVSDYRPDYQGPLAGIEAAFLTLPATTHYQQLLLLPCDLPQLSQEVPKRLLEALIARPDIDIAYASTRGQAHYLCAALRVTALESVRAQLDKGDRAVRHWYATQKNTAVLFDERFNGDFRNRNGDDKADNEDDGHHQP